MTRTPSIESSGAWFSTANLQGGLNPRIRSTRSLILETSGVNDIADFVAVLVFGETC